MKPNDAEIRERVGLANAAIAPLGMLLAKVEWGTAPLRTWVWRTSKFTDLNAKARSKFVVGDMDLHDTDMLVEDPSPADFPSQDWINRVMVLA